MKNKNFLWIALLIFSALIEPVVGANTLRYNRKIKFQNTDYLNNNFKFKNLNNYSVHSQNKGNNYFELQSYLNSFLKKFIVSLENDTSKIDQNTINPINIESVMQTKIGSKIIAEGEVKVRTKSAFLVSDKVTYDEKLKLLTINGNILFKTETQFLKAKTIEYNFKEKKGFILEAYGTTSFKTLSDIFKNSENILDEDFNKDLTITKVNLDNISNLDLSATFLDDDFLEPESEFKNGSISINLNSFNKIRFISKKIEINDNIWSAKKLSLTNDPFNKPQLVVKNRNFKLIINDNAQKIRSKWSTLVLDDKLHVPLGPLWINNYKNSNFRWGARYDKQDNDGIYIFRNFDTFELGKNKDTTLELKTIFNIQRAFKGKTKSYPLVNESILSERIEQDTKFLDYFGLGSSLKSNIGNWKYLLEAQTNTLDPEKLDSAIKIESFLMKNLYQYETFDSSDSGDFNLFGVYRDKTFNGSLGEIIVHSAYGGRFKVKKEKFNKNDSKTTNISFGFGKYESPSRVDSSNLIKRNRFDFKINQTNNFFIWKPSVENYIYKDHKYSPTVITPGLTFLTSAGLDIFRYDDNSKQVIYEIKAGPRLVLGDFKRNYFDYTELSLYPRFKFNRGESPFSFDQVVDKKVIEFNATQHLFSALAVNFKGEFNIDDQVVDDDKFINPIISLSWNRRAYNIALDYNFDTQEGGLKFKIYSFNFDGFGREFEN